jgi:hypothetical protein
MPVAVRIHSSGDFFSSDYIEFWNDLVRECVRVSFWAYTRSWTVPSLTRGLVALRDEPNVQLFASWDPTMVPPPDDWRLSVVRDPLYPLLAIPNLIDCPEEYDKRLNCATCGHCIRNSRQGVAFNVH